MLHTMAAAHRAFGRVSRLVCRRYGGKNVGHKSISRVERHVKVAKKLGDHRQFLPPYILNPGILHNDITHMWTCHHIMWFVTNRSSAACILSKCTDNGKMALSHFSNINLPFFQLFAKIRITRTSQQAPLSREMLRERRQKFRACPPKTRMEKEINRQKGFPFTDLGLKTLARLCECCRQVEADVVRNSWN